MTLITALAFAALAALAGGCWLRQRRLQARLEAATAAGRREAAERELLAAALARLTAALGCAEEGLIVLDRDGRIVAANAAAREFAALTPECEGRRLVDLVAWPALAAAVATATRGGAVEPWEQDAASASGRTLVVRAQALTDGVVVGIDDQSRLRRLESLRRDFVANVSHELKTPLAAIQGFVETLLDDVEMPAGTRHRFLERIARQAERLSTLVADLLTLSRLDAEGGRAAPGHPCSLIAVLRETVRDLQPLADKRTISLSLSLPAESVWVRAEREALRQVAGNLIDNAIKYTPPGGAVRVALAARGAVARLEVADTGIGLSPDDQERVFERFYRVDRARSRDVGGTGLGLSIVKNTVRGLGGDVGVQSRLGHGSTFWVELPCIPPPPADEGDERA
jgi:two-component system phosphate regulon sensor histidine kinase PhoR